MDNFQLDYFGKKYIGKKYIGAYPLNRIPQIKSNTCFIVNTHSEELPGEHWIAVNVTDLQIQIFDPFGKYYPITLINKLTKSRKRVIFNKTRYQSYSSNYCGLHCLIWLQYINNK